MNVILVDHDEDHHADRRYDLTGEGTWRVDDGINVRFIDPALFSEPRISRQFAELANVVTQG